MNLKILKEVLDSRSVPAINRIAGTSFDLSTSIDDAKKKVLENACEFYRVKLCETDEEAVISIVENRPTFTEDQQKIKKLLYKYGYSVIALEPDLKEDADAEEKLSEEELSEEESPKNNIITEDAPQVRTDSEAKVILESIGNTESDNREDGARLVLENIRHIGSKVMMCPDYASLYQLEEDFNSVGLTITPTSNHKVVLCKIGDGNKPQVSKIFEDYMYIGSSKNPDIEISSRMAECLVQFINRAASIPKKINNSDKTWLQSLAVYGDAFGISQDSVTK